MDSEKYTTGTDFGDRGPIMGCAQLEAGANANVRFASRSPRMDHKTVAPIAMTLAALTFRDGT